MKLIAFYLPQYYPIPENNEWWGEGFTEWTNVAKAKPLYSGHYQPHIPADLGFYDLRLEETRIAQAELAKEYGIGAFCYYHYWFNGKMLLERPFNEVLSSGKPDFPFCLCWANENWSRRWDGREQEVLMEQNYRDYNPYEHIEWLSSAFSDKRYLRIDNKPMFLVYYASAIPNLSEVIAEWRKAAMDKGFEGIYLCAAQLPRNNLTDEEIINAGFDAIFEFQPNLKGFSYNLHVSSLPGLNVVSYKKLVEASLKKDNNSNIVIFPCVFPSWDNSPRRRNEARIIQNEDAELYKYWLLNSIERVKRNRPEEQIVFINAWNEWGEGCHLEPDLKHGRMFLEATRQALIEDGQLSTDQNASNSYYQEKSIEPQAKSEYYEFNARRPIYIWGTGSSGDKTLKLFKYNRIRVKGWIDSDSSRWNTAKEGIKVYSPDFILDSKEENGVKPYIIIASMFDTEITPILESKNYVKYDDYAVNIYNMLVRTKNKGNQKVIAVLSEKRATCNICGYDQFVKTSEESKCKRCGSIDSERMIIQVFSEETGLNGLPLLEWPGERNIRVLGIGEKCSYDTYLESNYSFCKVNDINMGIVDFEEDYFDYVLLSDISIERISINREFMNELYRILKIEGKIIMNVSSSVDLPYCDNAEIMEITNIFKRYGFRLGFVFRDYPLSNIKEQRIILCKK